MTAPADPDSIGPARGLIVAAQLLTRLPMPRLAGFRPEWLGRAAGWFAPVGLVVGAGVALAALAGSRVDPWLAALLGTLAWVAITGGMHLDGLADLADGLGAAHRDRARLLEVMRDPHVGSFGVIALVCALLAKVVLLMLLARTPSRLWALPLLAAWARLLGAVWSATLPPIAAGSGAHAGARAVFAFAAAAAALVALSLWSAPPLLVAPLLAFPWWWFLHRRIGGMNGDCLGAGIELAEASLLCALVAAP